MCAHARVCFPYSGLDCITGTNQTVLKKKKKVVFLFLFCYQRCGVSLPLCVCLIAAPEQCGTIARHADGESEGLVMAQEAGECWKLKLKLLESAIFSAMHYE